MNTEINLTASNQQEQYKATIDILKPVIGALIGASGLTENQAKTAIYYAIVTWLYNELDFIPILEFRGNSGTGKSEAIRLLGELVANSKNIQGKTYSEIGYRLHQVNTAIIEEGDFTQERTEELLRDRCTKQLAVQTIHLPPDQTRYDIYYFGATIIHKREPFTDTAIRNRTITIKTRRKPGNYNRTNISNDAIKEIAEQIKKQMPKVQTSDRVSDTWKPLTMVATFLNDTEWLEYEGQEMIKATRSLAMGDQYEPEDILLKAVIACSDIEFKKNIKLVNLKRTVREHFDLKWSSQRIHAMLGDLGFQFKFYAGYDWLEFNYELLRRQAEERNIELSPPEQEEPSIRAL
ncbi:hypothetical protein ACFLUH_02845 [Chloroflexota bacterium]